MFGNKNEKGSAEAAPTPSLAETADRLGALSVADLAGEVMAAFVEARRERSGLTARSGVVSVLAPNAPLLTPSSLLHDADVQRVHVLVAEGLQTLQNAGLACLLIMSDVHFYALTRKGEDVVARGAVREALAGVS